MDDLITQLSKISTKVWDNVINPHLNFYVFAGFILCLCITFLIFYKTFLLLMAFQPNLTEYPYLNPPVFLSVGESLASVAILLAVYQFRKERGSIALEIRNYVLPVTTICMLSGLIITFVSPFVLIEQPRYIFHLSTFWQIIAGALILFSIVFLFLKTTNKNLFTRRTEADFYHVFVRELSRPSPERVQIILETFLENFDEICRTAKQDDMNNVSYARSILDVVLGESSMVDIISTKRLDALHYIIYTVEEHALDRRQVRGLLPIIKNLFSDNSSYLYQHLSTNGLALSSNLYEQIFGSAVIVNNFQPFSYPAIGYKMANINDDKEIEVVIKALSTTIEAYLKDGLIYPRNINDGLAHLSNIFGNLCRRINKQEQNDITNQATENDWWSLHTISHFLAHDYVFLAFQDKLNSEISDIEKTASVASFYSSTTINDGIAASLYKAFEQLSSILSTENTDSVYRLVLDLMYGMLYQYEYKTGYRTPFETMLWGQIKRNIEERTYPAVLAVYLTFMGLLLASDEHRSGWLGEQTEMLRRLLYIDLKPLLDTKEKMINGKEMEKILLPSYMKYDGDSFTYTMGFGEGTIKEIAKPKAGSKSVLNEVVSTQPML